MAAKATGGGPPPIQPSDLHWKLYNLIPSQFDRISCNVDSDAIKNSIFENERMTPTNGEKNSQNSFQDVSIAKESVADQVVEEGKNIQNYDQ